MKDDLLWVYEGLTEYYGELLAARGGLISAAGVDGGNRGRRAVGERAGPDLAAAAGHGRLRRRSSISPAADGPAGGAARTSTPEGSLIWLEADVTIRRLTGGKKTLDDFCTLFHGQGDNGRVWVKAYTAADVFDALNEVARVRLEDVLRAAAELEVRRRSRPAGSRVAATGSSTPRRPTCSRIPGRSTAASTRSARSACTSPPTAWSTTRGPVCPAITAGISNGMRIVAVNGRRFSGDEFKRALAASKTVDGAAGVHRRERQLLQHRQGRLSRRAAVSASRARRRARTTC